LVQSGRLDAAKRALDEGLALARARGSPVAAARVSSARALAGLKRGALAEAEADARTAIELLSEATRDIPYRMALAVLAAVLVERGELDSARETLELVVADPVADEATPTQALRESRAKWLMAAGEPQSALEQLRACARWEERWQLGPGVVPVPWRSAAALAQLRLGEREEARELAAQEVELARRFGAAPQLGIALRALGWVEAAAEPLEAAVSVLERSEARLEHARSLVELGSLRRRSGQRATATASLREGMDLAHRCGATALVHAARVELHLAGARPRRIALTGRDALTPSERRVADLAAEGMTNKEIAQALFVTLRTVEMHLSNAYRKLGISSRGELVSSLAP
jgi:ATP/maltotriose-dependent transcriptional regulator MalT